LDLPAEILLKIYFAIDTPADVLSLSTTCKTAREIYKCDFRIGMHMYPMAFKLLDFQRPGFIPAWKEEQLLRLQLGPWTFRPDRSTHKHRFLDLDYAEGRGLTVKGLRPLENLAFQGGEADRARLYVNHRYIESLIDKHVLFKDNGRVEYDSEWLDSFAPRKVVELFEDASDEKVLVQPLHFECNRIINTVYTAAVLQLRLYGFKHGNPTIKILDYAPIFELSLQDALELAVIVNKIYEEESNDYWHWETYGTD